MTSSENLSASPAQDREFLTFLTVIVTAMAANANVSLKPILIGSYVEFLKYSASSAGYVLTAEATATSLGTAAAALCVARLNRRLMIVVALAIIAIGNLLSLAAESLAALMTIRAFTGIGHGIALAVTVASIANFRQPDRIAGIVTVGVSAFSMGLMFFVPWAQSSIGIEPLFLTMAGLVVPPLLLLRALPPGSKQLPPAMSGSPAGSTVNSGQSLHLGTIILITLVAIGFFYVSVGSFWPFAEQFGRATGLSYEQASRVTGFALLATVIGSLIAIGMGSRFGRMLPVGFSISTATAGLVLLFLFPHSQLIFSIVAITYMFCWALLYPFMLGFTSKLDPGGRVNGLVCSLSLIGFAIAPGLASMVISIGAPAGGSNLSNLVGMSALCLLPAFALIYAIRRHERLVAG